jgi:hypothetical protein
LCMVYVEVAAVGVSLTRRTPAGIPSDGVDGEGSHSGCVTSPAQANGFTAKITVPKKDYIGVITAYENSLLMQYDVSLSAYAARARDDSVLFCTAASNL